MNTYGQNHHHEENENFTLLDICSKVVAESIPFSSIEERYDRIIPEPVQKKIIFYSFPKSEESILLYSTLNNNATLSSSSSSNNFHNLLAAANENPLLLDHQLNGGNQPGGGVGAGDLDLNLNGPGGVGIGINQFDVELPIIAVPSTSAINNSSSSTSTSSTSSSFSKGLKILDDFVAKCGTFHKSLEIHERSIHRINSRFNTIFKKSSSNNTSCNQQQQGSSSGGSKKKRRLKPLCSSTSNNSYSISKRLKLSEEVGSSSSSSYFNNKKNYSYSSDSDNSSDFDDNSSDDYNSELQSSSEDDTTAATKSRHSPTQRKALAKKQHHNKSNNNYSNYNTSKGKNKTPTPTSTKKTLNNNNHKSKRKRKRTIKVHVHHRIDNVLQVGFHLSGTVIQFNYNAYNLAMENNTPSKSSSSSTSNHSYGIGGKKQIIVQNCNKRVLCNSNSNELFQEFNFEANQQWNNPHSSKFSTSYRVSLTFDRCKITSTSCTCSHQDIFWCEHVVALALYRIRFADQIQLRVPISETLLQMDRNQLQKLVQYIISDHLAEILPTAQNYADLILRKCGRDEINKIAGAPDPTALPGCCGPDDEDDENSWRWYLDEDQVIQQVRACLSSKSNKLILGGQQKNTSSKHQILQSLFLKVREMLKAGDSNGPRLLTIITQEFLNNSLADIGDVGRSGQWRNLRERGDHQRSSRNNNNNNIVQAPICSTEIPRNRQLWDEIGHLWTCIVMNPQSGKEVKLGLRKLLLEFNDHPAACLLEDPSEIESESALEYLPCNECNCCKKNIESLLDNEELENSNARFNCKSPSLSPKPSTSKGNCSSRKRSHNHHHDTIASPKSSASSNSSGSSKRHNAGKNNALSSPTAGKANQPRTVFSRALDFTLVEWPKTFLIGLEDIVDLDLMTARVEAYRSHGHEHEAVTLAIEIVKSLRNSRKNNFGGSSKYSFSTSNKEEKFDLAKCPQHGFKSQLNRQLEPFYILFDTLTEAAFSNLPNNKRNQKKYSRTKLLALAFEVALKGLGMNREMPRGLYAQERAARLEERFIVKLQELEARVKSDARELRETLVKVLLRESRNFLLIGENGNTVGFYSEDEDELEISSPSNTNNHGINLRKSPTPKMQTRNSSPQPLNLNTKNTRGSSSNNTSGNHSHGTRGKASKSCKCVCKQCCLHHCSSRSALALSSLYSLSSFSTTSPSSALNPSLIATTKTFICSSAFSSSVGPSSMPVHVFGRYLFNSLLQYDAELAYEIGLRSMPLRYLDEYLKECDSEAEATSRGLFNCQLPKYDFRDENGRFLNGNGSNGSSNSRRNSSSAAAAPSCCHHHHRSLNRWYTLGHIEVQQCTLASTLLLNAASMAGTSINDFSSNCSNIDGEELDMLPAILDSAMQHIHSSSHLFRLAQECFRNATSSSTSNVALPDGVGRHQQAILIAHNHHHQQQNAGVPGGNGHNEAPNSITIQRGGLENQTHIHRLRLLSASYKLGLKVMRMTLNSVQRRRWEMVGWMVGCAVELGLDAVLNLLQNWWEFFTPTEAAGSLASVVMNRTMSCSSSSSSSALRSRFGGIRGMEELSRTAREVALQCARRDPPNCALNALTLCENEPIAFETAYQIVVDSATKNFGHNVSIMMTSQQIFTIARYMEHRGYPMRAYKLALLAMENVIIGFNQDTHPAIADIHWACGLSHSLGKNELNGIVPILVKNVKCATVLSDILKRCSAAATNNGPIPMLNPSNTSNTSSTGQYIMGNNCSTKKSHHHNDLCGHSSSKKCHSQSNKSSNSSLANSNGNYSIPPPCPASCPHFATSSSNQIQAHSRHPPHLMLNYDRPPLKHLVDSTIAAFINTIHSRLTHISPRHYTDFIEYLSKARESFLLSSDGLEKFHQMLDNMSLTYKGKKKLMFLVKERFGELNGTSTLGSL